MRILAIRGENLASLADPFRIDLADGPLALTGLFAITGETGAGKSTILDALCLALYGQYPRVSVGRREEVPDPSGQALGAGDGRVILRRGAGQGFAEVDFLGQDGIAYRARWAANRARLKPHGRLQSEARSLTRLDDGSAVAAGKTDVTAAVVARTDLTFDQFRRTVVLAQGEFDAFLLASEADRADLLEKITGTEIYSAISRQVHAGTETERAAINALTARREAIGLLAEEARAALSHERAALGEGLPTLAAEHAALREILDRAGRVASAEARRAEAEQALAAAEAAIVAAAAETAMLAEHDAVEPARGPFERLAAATNAAAVAADLLAIAEAEAADAESAQAAAEAAHAAAAIAEAAAAAEAEALAPVWREADRLDARIADCRTRAEAARARASAAADGLARAEATCAGLERRQEEAAAARAALARRLDAAALAALLADRAEEIAGLFAKHAALTADAHRARDALAAAEAAVRASEASATAAGACGAAARETRARHVAARDGLAAERAGLDEDAVRARAERLAALAEPLAEAAELAKRHAEAVADAARAEAAAAEAATARAAAAGARAGSEAERQAAARARAEIAALADLAEGSVSREAAALRSLLVADEPCPVCGGREHPHRHDRGALADLAEAMRGRRAALDAELARADAAIRASTAAQAEAEARLDAARREGARAGERGRACTARYTAMRPALAEALAQAGLDAAAPDALGPDAPARFAAGAEALRAARAGTDGRLRHLRDLGRAIEARGRAIEAAEAEIEAAEAQVRAAAGPREQAALRGARERARAEALAERLDSLARELRPALTAADLAVADLARDPAGSAARVAAIGVEFRALRAQERRLEAEAAEILPHLAASREEAAAVRGSLAEAQAAALAGDAALAEALAQRAGLLGGEATDRHRDRVLAAQNAARAERDRCDGVRRLAAEAGARARAAAAHAGTQAERAAAAASAADRAFRAACGARAPEAVVALLAEPPETRAAYRAAQERRLRAREAAAAALATRRADLDALATREPIDVPATEAAAAAVAERLAAAQQRLGALDTELARDDAARAGAAELADAVEAARAGLAVWEAVDAAVGSASGDKFRRFAQGVTLEHLVRLANAQLHVLSPRYRLARSRSADLALHVIDRDMGEELRGTRSLSGGERFLVSLALALALSGLEGRQAFVDTLFIDEGFGSLDAETLDLAVDALETLQGSGRKVGVITHVAGMMERIAVQIRVEKRGSGRSVVRVVDRGAAGT